MISPQPPKTKRNSGRTGRRRMTQAEVWLNGPKSVREHVRRHGLPIGKGGEMPSAPAWFTPNMHAIWRELLDRAAPLQILHPVDHGALVGLVVAADRHACLAAEVAGLMMLDPPGRVSDELDRALRRALAAMLQAGNALGLTPAARARTGVGSGYEDDGFVLLEPGSA